MDDENTCKCPRPGAPAWMSTFADLMSLLMTFFVLLLSFSEMDVLKFKQIAGSIQMAFGVQNRVELKDIPKGTSVIAQDFSPGKPTPTPIDIIMQETTEVTKQMLDVQDGDSNDAGGSNSDEGNMIAGKSISKNTDESSESELINKADMEEVLESLQRALQEEIKQGAVELENLGQQLVIRIREQGAFPQGSAFLQPKFRPLIHKIAGLVIDIPGIVQISGHTDTDKINSELYRSSWDLSSQRAVSVAQEMEKVKGFSHQRIEVRGMADTQPLVLNDSRENRAINRRVEIAIIQGKPKYSQEVPALPEN